MTQLEHFRQWRIERKEEIEKQEQDKLAAQVKGTAAWLDADINQEDILVKHSRAYGPDEEHWILKTPLLASWLDKARETPMIWLNGKPGAGKSLLI